MLEGSPPIDTALPPPIKWYLRFLHKCFVKSRGEGSPNPCGQITSKDLQFLFWPFLSTSGDHESSTSMKISDSHGNGTPLHSNNAHVQQDEELQQENLTGETSWCLQYGVEFAKWRDKLCTHLCTDLKIPMEIAVGDPNAHKEKKYNWLPASDYLLSPTEFIHLHNLLLHHSSQPEELELGLKRGLMDGLSLGTSTVGIVVTLLDILARETQACECCHAHGGSNHSAAECIGRCCGCNQPRHQVLTKNAGLLLLCLVRRFSKECDVLWVFLVQNLIVAAPTARENFALEKYDPSCELLTDRVLPCVGQLADLPMPAMHSVLLSCIKHEIDAVLLRGMRELLPNQAEALSWAERSGRRLEQVIWPTLVKQIDQHPFLFVYYASLEHLALFGAGGSAELRGSSCKISGVFPCLQELSPVDFIRITKKEPQYTLPLLQFLKAGRSIKVVEQLLHEKRGQPANPFVLDKHALQQEDHVAAIHHQLALQQNSGQGDLQLDFFCLEVVAFSGGSFQCFFGMEPGGDKAAMDKDHIGMETETFEEDSNWKKPDKNDRTHALASFEGRLLLAYQLQHWTQGVGVRNVKFSSKFESLKKVYYHVLCLYCIFPAVDERVSAELSALKQVLTLWPEEKAQCKMFQSKMGQAEAIQPAKRPKFDSLQPRIPTNLSQTGEEKAEPDWIVEAICRSSCSLEKHLQPYLRGFGKRDLGTGRHCNSSQQNAPSSQVSSQGDTGARSESSPQQTVVKYLVSNPCKIPAMGTFAQNPRVLKVAWKAIQKVLMVTNIPAQTDIDVLELWIQFLENYRNADNPREKIAKLMDNDQSILAPITQYVFLTPCPIASWSSDLMERVFTTSRGIVRRAFGEAWEKIQHLSAGEPVSYPLIDVVKNSEAVATFLEAELSSSNCVGCITVDSEELAKKKFMSKAGILDLLSMVFASCKPDLRNNVLIHLKKSNLFRMHLVQDSKEGSYTMDLGIVTEDLDEGLAKQGQQLEKGSSYLLPLIMMAVIFWHSKLLDEVEISERRSACMGVWKLNPTEQRALICHILATSQPPTLDSLPCYDQSPAAAMTGASLSSSEVSCEEMLCKLEAIFPAEDKLRRHHEVVDWVLLCCRLCIRMNIANIGAICRLHPQTVRDILVHRIDEDSDQARMLGEKGSSWLTCLQELSSELSNGLLAWLPVEVHLNFTNTNMAIPGTFWDETNSSKLVEELVTCLASSDLGVRCSTYAFVVAQCHRRDFIGLLAHGLCEKIKASVLSEEQEALLGILIPCLLRQPMHQCSKGHQPLVSIILQATEKALGIQSHMKESLKTEQHVKALLRVILVACQASPASFAQGMMPRLLFGLVLTEELNEEVLVGAMRCLVVLSAHLPKTSDIVTQIRNLLLHLFQKPSGDYIWYLAMTCGESIAMHLCPIPSVPGFGPISPGDTTMASTRTEGFPTPDIILKCNNNQDNLVSSRLLKRVIPLKGLLFRFHAFLASRPA
ncbi:hypothetical protein CY35_06G085600 [Sphagnum magellanicum]|nr:hypothetical protein CY35_06G085600 [Sphagnum magellanicum]